MASQHIEVPSTASRLSADVRRAVDAARVLQDLVVKSKDIMDQVASGDDWPALATKLGVTAAEAEAVYNLVAAVMDEVSTSVDYNALIDRLG